MRIKNRQHKRERKKDARKPGREFHQHVRGLSPENILGDRAAESSPQTLALWPLHQDHKDHEYTDQHKEHQAETNQKIHREAKYEYLMANDK